MGFEPNIEVTISTGVGFLSRTSKNHPGRRGWLCVFLRIWVGFFSHSGYSHLKAAQHREVRSIYLCAALPWKWGDPRAGEPRLLNPFTGARINTAGNVCQKWEKWLLLLALIHQHSRESWAGCSAQLLPCRTEWPPDSTFIGAHQQLPLAIWEDQVGSGAGFVSCVWSWEIKLVWSLGACCCSSRKSGVKSELVFTFSEKQKNCKFLRDSSWNVI